MLFHQWLELQSQKNQNKSMTIQIKELIKEAEIIISDSNL